jgi:hypothetical protein
VPGVDGHGPNLFGTGNIYLLILKSDEGTIYALVLEPTGQENTYRRIGVAQMPEDDGMADNWDVSELILI